MRRAIPSSATRTSWAPCRPSSSTCPGDGAPELKRVPSGILQCTHRRGDKPTPWQPPVGDTNRAMSVRTSLSEKKLQKAVGRVRRAQARFTERYPGDSGARQPVHTVYGGAHLFASDTARKLG